ncbi:DUF1538 domain-containing protein [Ferrimonas balearica]|uniref:DUF1538 domain-containing protein n=1 Tax=Ferrimonas balearica TaxID=44012 RepID=UPI001C98FAE2|nr:DUF1538 domain-containing protein [Ferrimonas balearica]MBY5922180.1 DUF1538 domain-containing protein [Ferrimonas balearica]MBY5994480.1 DUF1538 domain-containing protein [Ferrimonas balearica]
MKLGNVLRTLLSSARDLLPIVLVVGFFQLVVLGQPLPRLDTILIGLGLVIAGLTLFVYGLELALFPLGESLARAFARRGSLFWLLSFAFLLGFGTTVAEPALIAVSEEAAEVAAEAGVIALEEEAQARYADRLRLTVALSVGVAILLGVLRILLGWPLHRIIIAGYLVVMVLTLFAPADIIGIAYDSGGVTTSTITVPLVTALGVGLATSIEGRNPLLDGFGLIAFASLLPIIFVLGFGILRPWIG